MCDREWEVIESLQGGRVDAEVNAHAAQCASCGDLMRVASALLDDRQALMREAQIPGSGRVWWRTMLRAQQESVRRAALAGRILQAALVLAAMIAGIVWIGPKNIDAGAIISAMSGFVIPGFALVAFLILAPAAVYLVLTEE